MKLTPAQDLLLKRLSPFGFTQLTAREVRLVESLRDKGLVVVRNTVREGRCFTSAKRRELTLPVPKNPRNEALELAKYTKAAKEGRALGIRESIALVQRWVWEIVGDDNWDTGKRKAIQELETLLRAVEDL